MVGERGQDGEGMPGRWLPRSPGKKGWRLQQGEEGWSGVYFEGIAESSWALRISKRNQR